MSYLLGTGCLLLMCVFEALLYTLHSCLLTLLILCSLEFGTIPTAERGAPPVFTNDILAMVSPEKESVPLIKVIDMKLGSLFFSIVLLFLLFLRQCCLSFLLLLVMLLQFYLWMIHCLPMHAPPVIVIINTGSVVVGAVAAFVAVIL